MKETDDDDWIIAFLMSDNFDSVFHAEVLGTVSVHGLSSNWDLSLDEGLDKGGDFGQDEGLEAVGVTVTVEAGVQGQLALLASGGELLAVLSRDQVQELLGLVAAGTNMDGKSRDWEAGKWQSALGHLNIDLGSNRESFQDLGIKVNLDLGTLLGHNRVGVDGECPWVDEAVVFESWASLEVGLGHGNGCKGKNNGEGLHL